MSAEQCGPAVFPASRLPHQIAEGVLAEAVAEIKNALDDIYENMGADRLDECLAANQTVMMLEANKVGALLDDVDDSDLRPKHRAARAIFAEFKRRMFNNVLEGGAGPRPTATFARDVVTFLECVHMCLREDTDRKKRYYWKRRFLDG